jgi:hypothetical protein
VVDASEECAGRLKQALREGKKALKDGRSAQSLNRETLDALLTFFDKWSNAEIQGWNGLAKVEEEAEDLRTVISSKSKKQTK